MARNKYSGSSTPHAIEWIVGIASAVLVLTLVAFVAVEAIVSPNEPPRLSVTILDDLPKVASNEVRFQVFNAADATASAVVVRGELKSTAGSVETAEVTFDYVPARSSAKGSLIFSAPIGGREIKMYAVGYVDP